MSLGRVREVDPLVRALGGVQEVLAGEEDDGEEVESVSCSFFFFFFFMVFFVFVSVFLWLWGSTEGDMVVFGELVRGWD